MVAKLSMSVMQNLLATCWFFMINVWYWNKNILYFVIYMLYNRYIFFFIYIFPIERSMLKTKWLADLN